MTRTKLTVDDGIIDILLVAFAVLLCITIILSIVLDVRSDGFKLVPMWITLIALCLVSKEQGGMGVLVGLTLCFASEYVCYFDKTTAVKWEKIPPVIISEVLVLIPMWLLAATKLDNARTNREQEYLGYKRRQEESHQLFNSLKKAEEEAKESETKTTKTTHDNLLVMREKLLEFTMKAYREIFAIRFKREVPKLLETIINQLLKVPQGIVFEVGESGRDLRLRNHWGLDELKGAEAMASIGEQKSNEALRSVADTKKGLLPGECKKDMRLLDAYEAFSKELFPPEYILPIVVQQKSSFLIVLGPARADDSSIFDIKQVQTLLESISMTLMKVESKDARPSFSTFRPGE